jgi:hypothetical protein
MIVVRTELPPASRPGLPFSSTIAARLEDDGVDEPTDGVHGSGAAGFLLRASHSRVTCRDTRRAIRGCSNSGISGASRHRRSSACRLSSFCPRAVERGTRRGDSAWIASAAGARPRPERGGMDAPAVEPRPATRRRSPVRQEEVGRTAGSYATTPGCRGLGAPPPA